jgi:4-hydroxybenzoate polyprenyltransferase
MLIAQADSIPAAPVLAIMAFGVLLAMGGHIWKSRAVIVAGLAILFLATAAMVVGGYVAYQGDETDPREQKDPREPGF